MKTFDDLLIQQNKLKELVRFSKLFGGKVSIGDEIITHTKLKEMLNEVKIEIETRRSNNPLRRVK